MFYQGKCYDVVSKLLGFSLFDCAVRKVSNLGIFYSAIHFVRYYEFHVHLKKYHLKPRR